MKRILIIGFLTLSAAAFAQSRDAALDSVLRIKRNPDYIADWCTLASKEEAVLTSENGVLKEVDNYLKEKNFKHILSAQDLSGDIVRTYTCYMQELNRYRSISYVSRKTLMEMEQLMDVRFQDHGRAAIESLLEGLASVRTVDGVQTLFKEGVIDEYVLWGILTFETPQQYLDNGYFVFFDEVSGKVIDILTPQDPVTQERKSYWTGKVTDPLQYEEEVLWIFINMPAE